MITFEEFEKIMCGIGKELAFQDQIYSAFMKLGGDYYRDTPSVNSTITLLDKIFCDDSEYPLIDYWVYELDFGKNWRPGCVTDNGIDVKLETVSDLYDLLLKKKAERGDE